MITAVSIFSCTNDYDPGLIENLGMKEQPLRIITKVLTTKSPNFMQEFTRGSVIGLHVISESTGNIYDSNPDYKNVRAEAFLVNNKLNWRQSLFMPITRISRRLISTRRISRSAYRQTLP